MEIFRGYIKTKNKESIMKYKNVPDEKLLSLNEARDFKEYAGVLALEIILIDVDDFEQSEKLLKIIQDQNVSCRVYQTTRGKHFFFRNTNLLKGGNGIRLAIGLTADIKLGSKGGYSVLKFDGMERQILRNYPGDSPDFLPKYLHPVNSSCEFLDMEDGDGRNSETFRYLIPLQSAGLTVEEAKKCVRLINQHIFKEPIKERELENILRDAAFAIPIFYKNKVFQYQEFTKYVIANNNIIKINKQLHIYYSGKYIHDMEEIERRINNLVHTLNYSNRKEVIRRMSLLIEKSTPEANARHIVFQNGRFDIFMNTFKELHSGIIVRNIIPWNYNPAAESALVDEVLNKISCHDNDTRLLLEEIAGYCFYRRNELGKAFILTGDGANGKSTYIDMVMTMLGEENISSLALNELSEKFQNAELFGKLANLGDDIGEEFIASSSVFKKLVTGERIQVQRKGQDPFEFNNYAKMIFSANNIPRIRDKSGGLRRRLIILPFDAVFSKNDPDYKPYIKYDLRAQECMEYFIKLAIKGLQRVLTNDEFTTPQKSANALQDYEKENNSIVGFIDEFGVDNFLNNSTKDMYNRYSEYCMENGLKEAYSQISFSRYICKKCEYITIRKTIQNKKYYVFVKEMK